MRCRRPFVIATLVLSTLVLAPVLAFSETFVDLYAGVAMPMDTETTFNSIKADSKSPYKDSFLFGGRVGYYFEGVPWVGLALDASYFKADINLPNGAKQTSSLSRPSDGPRAPRRDHGFSSWAVPAVPRHRPKLRLQQS